MLKEGPRLEQYAKTKYAKNCLFCRNSHVRATHSSKMATTRLLGQRPGANWEIDYTEIKLGLYGYKYLLVLVFFSAWGEALPTKKETGQHVDGEFIGRNHSQVWATHTAVQPSSLREHSHLLRLWGWSGSFIVHFIPRVQDR